MSEVIRISCPYRPLPGHFSKPRSTDDFGVVSPGIWQYCREVFHRDNRGCGYFFYAHNPGKLHHVAAFIEKIENTIGINIHSEIGPTQRKTISWVRPARWWWVQSIKRSLYTCLLRAALNYDVHRDNFKEALYSVSYTKETRYAVERFLSGYIKYTGRKHGWCSQFFLANKETVDCLLILP